VTPAADGRIFAVGHTEVTSDNTDGWALLVDSDRGTVIWQKALGGAGRDEFYGVARVDSCYLAVGRTSSSGCGDFDLWAVEFDIHGNILWQRTAGGPLEDGANAVTALPGGSAVAAGYTWSEGSGGSDLWLVKLDGAGEVEWSRVFGGLGQDKAFAVAPADSEMVVAAGVTYSFSSVSGDAYLVACDAWGQEVWSGFFGGAGYDFAKDAEPDGSGGVVCACWSKRQTCCVWIFDVDRSGGMTAERASASMSDLRAESLEPWPGGGWVVAGTVEEPATGDRDIFAWLLDGSLNTLWAETVGGATDEYCTDAAVLPDGRMVVAGAAGTSDKGDQGWLVCLRPSAGQAGAD